MKNINWRTKAVYLLIAAVLAIGLVPGLASTVSAGPAVLSCSISPYTAAIGVNQHLSVLGTSNISTGDLDDISWDFDGLNYSGSSDELGPHDVWGDEGWYRLTLTVSVDTLEAHSHAYIYIDGYMLEPALAHNVLGMSETFSLPEGIEPGNGWYVEWSVGGSALPYIQVPWIDGGNNDDSITVQCIDIGATLEGVTLVVTANVWDGEPEGLPDEQYEGVKMWGKIDATVLQAMVDGYPAKGSSSPLVWNENDKEYDGGITVIETVLGSYDTNWGVVEIPADGAVVHWFVVDGSADVSGLASLTNLEDLKDAIFDMPDAELVNLWGGDDDPTDPPWIENRQHRITVSGQGPVEGVTSIDVEAEGAASCYIIAVATYPDETITLQVHPEIQPWTFFVQETSVVPEVRWVGEKIVLEKFFGEAYNYCPVEFTIVEGEGSLIRAYQTGYIDIDMSGDSQTVYTIVEQGIARVILESTKANQVNVLASVYNYPGSGIYAWPGELVNEHLFMTYFLKLEDITLGNVEGARISHDSGLFVADAAYDSDTGPWDASVDQKTGEVNVSTDTLLRAQVRGWFIGNQNTSRGTRVIDSNNDGDNTDPTDITLPAGRWILPDDWAYLASADWEEDNANWDIMDNPMDDVMSDGDYTPYDCLGDYVTWGVDAVGNDIITGFVADWPVVGPYSTLAASSPYDWLPFEQSIVPNGELDMYDCPMPPALVVFDIKDGLGYFRAVDKCDVYYKLLDLTQDEAGYEGFAHTNPFYALCIPANPWLEEVYMADNGGYLWNTWDDDYGWYDLWTFVDWNDANKPTLVKVYSDNHGEAMVWLNGDNGLDTVGANPLAPLWWGWTTRASNGETVVVGDTLVQARAKYPYFRADQPVYSNTVTKTWTWGEEKLVDIIQLAMNPNDDADPAYPRKLILVWLTDRDGMPLVGATVKWTITTQGATIYGVWGAGAFGNYSATTTAGSPTGADLVNWNATKLGSCHHAVTGVMVLGSVSAANIQIDITFPEGQDLFGRQLNFLVEDMIDPELTAGLNTGVYDGKAQSIVDATLTIGPRGSNTLVAIWWKDNTGVWHAYQPGAPDWANDLSMLETGNTYWVNVSANCVWNWALN